MLEGHADRESRLSLAQSYREVGELTTQIDTIRDALAVHQRALAMFEDLAREAPDDPEIRRESGKCLLAVGLLMLRTDGGTAEGFDKVNQARAAIELAAAGKNASNDDRALLARIQSYIADHHHNQGHLDLALGASARSCEGWESLIQAGDQSEFARFGYAVTLDTRGLILKNLDRFPESIEAYAKARGLAESLFREHPAAAHWSRVRRPRPALA